MKFWNKLSIKIQFTCISILFSSIIIIVTEFINFERFIYSEIKHFKNTITIQANLLADFIAPSLLFKDLQGAKTSLEKLAVNKNFLQAIIYDNNNKGFIRYSPYNLDDLSQKLNSSKINLVEDKINFKLFTPLIFYIQIPIKHKSNIFGSLYIELTNASFVSTMQKYLFNTILLNILVLILISFLIVILLNYILKPIIFLANKVKEVTSSQDYSIRIKDESSKEISTLFQIFNILFQDIDKLTKNLKEKVLVKSNELKHTQDILLESDKMSLLGNLVSGIAHEVNTPLGNALVGSSIINKECNKIQKSLETNTLKYSELNNSIDVLQKTSVLLNTTLVYASNLVKGFKEISVDQRTDELRNFFLISYLKEIFLTNNNKLKKIPVSVRIKYISNTDTDTDTDIKLKSFPGIVAQIFNNLIQNSIIHGFENIQKQAKINITIFVKNDNLIVHYYDNGKGIKENIINNIFEPFITTKRSEGSCGLGLNIIHNLVFKKLKGSIKVISKINQGSKFILTFPINLHDNLSSKSKTKILKKETQNIYDI